LCKAVVTNTKKIKCLAFAVLLTVILDVSARALDPNQPASSFVRTHFTTDDGLPGAVVDEVVQTQDGFLWVITNRSFLTRFDGKNFTGFVNPRASTLAIAPDGDLWIGTYEGLMRIPSSSFNQFKLSGLTSYQPGPGKASQINCLRFSTSGVLWIGTEAGLLRYEKEQFVAVGPRVSTHQIKEAPDGHLLVLTEEGFMELAGSEVVPHPGLADQLGVKDKEIFDVVKDHHGNTWYCTGKGVARETNGRIEKLEPNASLAALRAYEDAQGTVWIAKEQGLFRATSTGLELVDKEMQVRSFNNDRDGNLWISLVVPYTYVYDSTGDKRRTLQFRAAGIVTPTSFFFTRDRRVLVTPGCYAFEAN